MENQQLNDLTLSHITDEESNIYEQIDKLKKDYNYDIKTINSEFVKLLKHVDNVKNNYDNEIKLLKQQNDYLINKNKYYCEQLESYDIRLKKLIINLIELDALKTKTYKAFKRKHLTESDKQFFNENDYILIG